MILTEIRPVLAWLVLLVAGTIPALSQTQLELCGKDAGLYPADKRVDACAALIGSGQWSGEGLAPLFNNRGRAWTAKGNPDRAIADYDRAIQINPNYANAYNGHGNVWKAKGNLDRAMADYDKAIQINPSLAEPYSNRGNTWQAKGNLDRALADYDKAIQINPNLALAYNGRGIVWKAKGNLDRALADYDKAIQINPNYALAYNSRCWARAIAGRDLSQALTDCNTALRIRARDAAMLDSRGLVYLKLGAYDKAIADYTAVLLADANAASALYGRGIGKRRSGDKAGGDADVARAKAIKADIAQVYSGYGVQ